MLRKPPSPSTNSGLRRPTPHGNGSCALTFPITAFAVCDLFSAHSLCGTPRQRRSGYQEVPPMSGRKRSSILKSEEYHKVRYRKLSCNAGLGRTIVELKPQQTFFCQGDAADSVFYLQKGRAKVTVVSQRGKEATITLLSAGEFVGEGSLAAIAGLRLSTATAMNTCTALKISRTK